MQKKQWILSVVLSVFMIFSTTFCVQAENAPFAAATKVEVTFNGKKVIFNSDSEPKTIKSLEKKWGKKTRTEEDNDLSIWKKGETEITIGTGRSGKTLGYVGIDTEDTNISIAGIRVGMDKDDVVRKMQKMYGKNNVLVTKKGQDWDFYGEDGYIAIGTPGSEEDTNIYVLRGHYFPISFGLTDGRVSEMHWMRL